MLDRDRAHAMLRTARDEVKHNYYDPTFHGMDLDARFKEYDARIGKAQSVGETFRIIAAFLDGFHDSHLFFMPPSRSVSYATDYRMTLIGDRAFITGLRPGSVAADKLMLGDEVLKYNGYRVDRDDIHAMQYFYRVLAPQPTDQLEIGTPHGTLTVSLPSHERKSKLHLDISHGMGSNDLADLINEEHDLYDGVRDRWVKAGDVTVWKMHQFWFDADDLDEVFESAQGSKGLVIDLRGNPGGAQNCLLMLIGRLFDHDVKVADIVSRKNTKPLMAKHVSHPYKGKIMVLVDSGSASCSEMFAKVMQQEKRGTVVGDLSAGAVMQSMQYGESMGTESLVLYAFSITSADVIMTDGKSLEKVGVTPDVVALPAIADLRENRDPVLAKAVELADGKLSAEEAAKLFPYRWPKLQ